MLKTLSSWHDAAVLPAQGQVARHRSAGHRAHLGEEPAELLGVLVLEELREPPPDELVLAVAEDALDRRRVVADREVGREQGDDVARVLDERAEPLGALALMEICREIGALESERNLSSECLDTLPRLPGEALGRAEHERHVFAGDGERDLGTNSARSRDHTGGGHRHVVCDELDRHALLADDVARRVGSDDVDVLARPGGDERRRR